MTPTAAQAAKPGFRSTLRNHYFLRLWIAQLISQVIQNTTYYGSIVLLSNQSGNSATAVGGVIIAFSVPAVLFGVPAGVMVDRLDKRALLWVSNAVRALLAFGFIAAIMLGAKAIALIYCLTFLSSVVGQFFGPAEGATIPLLVGEDELLPALSLFNITFSISQALGLVIIGPLILFFAPTLTLPFGQPHLVLTPIYLLFIFIGLMYGICAILTRSIPRERLIGTPLPAGTVQPEHNIISVWRGVVEAATFVRQRKLLLIAVLQLTIGGTIISIIATISSAFAAQFLHRNAEFAAIVFVPAGLGLVVGSVLMPKIIDRIGLSLASALGVIGVSACVVLLTICRWLAIDLDTHNWYNAPLYLAIAMLLAFGIGMSLDLITLPAQTAMQRQAPDWIKGRVLAFQIMLLNVATIPATLLIGVVSDRLSLPVALNVLAIIVVLLGLTCVYQTEHQRVAPAMPSDPIIPARIRRENTTDSQFKGAPSNPLPLTNVGTYDPTKPVRPVPPLRKKKDSDRLPTRRKP